MALKNFFKLKCSFNNVSYGILVAGMMTLSGVSIYKTYFKPAPPQQKTQHAFKQAAALQVTELSDINPPAAPVTNMVILGSLAALAVTRRVRMAYPLAEEQPATPEAAPVNVAQTPKAPQA